MAALKPDQARASKRDDRWEPRPYPRDELVQAVLDGGMAGVVSHPLDNVLWKVGLLCEGDPGSQFGLSGVCDLSETEVMRLVAEASGWEPHPGSRFGPVQVDPARVLEECERAGDRLAVACDRGERVILATGHPTGLPLLYAAVGRELRVRGLELLTPFPGRLWQDRNWGLREIRYVDDVAMVVGRGMRQHTHSARPMELMLQEASPDLVFADHGFAGTAIEAGIDTISIADVNDPALLVAKAQGRTDVVIVMDDNVRPDAYWPCFQAIAARLP